MDEPNLYRYIQKNEIIVNIINQLDAVKFPMFLARLSTKVQDDKIFTSDEETKLVKAFEFRNIDDLQSVISFCKIIFLEAAFNLWQSEEFMDQLKGTKLNDNIITILTDVWTTNAKEIVKNLKKKDIGIQHLSSFDWMLNLEVSDSSNPQTEVSHSTTNAIFNFQIDDPSKKSNKTENTIVEFKHDDLYNFFNKLEKIQAQLDALS